MKAKIVHKRYIFTYLAIFFVSLFFSNASGISAQSLTTGQGLTISPFLLERKMEKGETSDEIIDITNTSDRTLPVDITINDFVPIGENGQQVFLDPGQGDPHFSLSSWIQIKSSPKPILAPREKTTIEFSITAPQDADEGGHYGAILFTFQGSSPQGSAVAVTQKLGAIILVKLGKANEQGQISKFSAEKWFYEKPDVTFVTRFKNTGNVHVKPRGGISIYNIFGKKIATTLVNENANNVLANSEREFKSSWKDSFAFGRYRAEVKLVYGDSGSVETSSTTFWIIPWKTTLAFGLILFLLIIGFIFGLRRYNRWLLSQAYANNPPPKRRTRSK